jgi:hypothetical protein
LRLDPELVRAGFRAGNGLETESHVEPGGGTAVGTKAQKVKVWAGKVFHIADQPPADALPAKLCQNIEVTDAPNTSAGCIGIAIEAADADHTLTSNGGEQRLSGPIEAVFAGMPVIEEASHELEARGLALLEKLDQATGRQVKSLLKCKLIH